GEQSFTRDLAQSARKLQDMVSRVESGKGTLGKLVQDEQLYDELTGTLRELRGVAYDVRKGDGTLGQLVKDREAYEQTLRTVEDVRGMVASVKQNADALKSLPVVRSYVVDADRELVRPDR